LCRRRFGKAIEPGLRLFGLTDRFGPDRPARCDKLSVAFVWRQSKLVSCRVDGLAKLVQIVDDGRHRRACQAISLVIEQTPFARCRRPQCSDQRRHILRFEFRPMSVEASKSISLCHADL